MGINLPLALKDVGIARGTGVIGGTVSRRAVIESVGIRVDANEPELGVDNPRNHLPQLLIPARKGHIGPDLGPRIAKPHRMDIACINKSSRRAVLILPVMHRSIQRIRETIGKHPLKLGIRKKSRHPGRLRFYSLAGEKPLPLRRPP